MRAAISSSNRHEQVDVRGDAARERLPCNVDSGAGEAQALSLDCLMLDELVPGGVGDRGREDPSWVLSVKSVKDF